MYTCCTACIGGQQVIVRLKVMQGGLATYLNRGVTVSCGISVEEEVLRRVALHIDEVKWRCRSPVG